MPTLELTDDEATLLTYIMGYVLSAKIGKKEISFSKEDYLSICMMLGMTNPEQYWPKDWD